MYQNIRFREVFLCPGELPHYLADDPFCSELIDVCRVLLVLEHRDSKPNNTARYAILGSTYSNFENYKKRDYCIWDADRFRDFIEQNQPRDVWDAAFLLYTYSIYRDYGSEIMEACLAYRAEHLRDEGNFSVNRRPNVSDHILSQSYGLLIWHFQLEQILSCYISCSPEEGSGLYSRLRQDYNAKRSEVYRHLESISIESENGGRPSNLLDLIVSKMPVDSVASPGLKSARILIEALQTVSSS